MDQIIAEIKKIPPVTRFVCGSSLVVTGATITNIVSPYSVVFVKDLVFKKFEIWRLYTSFFHGGGGLRYIFEFVMLYRTAHELESKSYVLRSADLAWQLLIASVLIFAATWPLDSFLFARPLLICMVYANAALAPPDAMASVMGLLTVPVQYFPYILIALDFLVEGPRSAARSVAGAAVGHLWWWGVWGGTLGSQGIWAAYASAPQWMRSLIGETNHRRPPAAGGSAAGLARMGVHVTAPRGSATSGGSSTTGYSWGSGQRLGDS